MVGEARRPRCVSGMFLRVVITAHCGYHGAWADDGEHTPAAGHGGEHTPEVSVDLTELASSLTFPNANLNTVNITDFGLCFKNALATKLSESTAENEEALVESDEIEILRILPGSIIVEFSISVPVADVVAVEGLLETFKARGANLVVTTSDGAVSTANSAYLMPVTKRPACVSVECGHAEHSCAPSACDEETECFLADCPEESLNSTACFTVAMLGFQPKQMMCQEPPCVPHTCGCGDHDCLPVYCDGEGGRHCDPCHQGHHGDDGLSFWPFLLFSLGVAICFTALLSKLSSGACCGKSCNPPFTVLMFFVGYFLASWVSHEHEIGEILKDSFDSSHILINSVDAWKTAHPHVILFCLLPPLLFEDASSMEFYTFRKVLMSSTLLAGPGVGLSMLLTAASSMLLFGFQNECALGHDGVEVCEDTLPVSTHRWRLRHRHSACGAGSCETSWRWHSLGSFHGRCHLPIYQTLKKSEHRDICDCPRDICYVLVC
jgi:hypothetical protein